MRFMYTIALALLIAVPLASCFSNVSCADDTPPTLKPEMIIRFTQGTLACVARDDLREIIDHGVHGEATKMQAMMLQNGGSCLMISPKKRFKIISVEYNDPTMPDVALVEFVGEGAIAMHGAWALSIGAEPIPVKRKTK
jgi:hypothetical protein